MIRDSMPVNPLQPLKISAYTAVSNCGIGKSALLDGLLKNETQLGPLQLFETDFPVFAGEVDNHTLPEVALAQYRSRNTRIALAALDVEADRIRENIARLVQRYGRSRIGVVIGTSTSSIDETEQAYRCLLETGKKPPAYHFSTQHAWVSTAHFIQKALDLSGPCYAISTACSSASKAIISAQRLIHSGVCDAVLAGGVDSLCQMTVHGFNSLELVSGQPCQPLDQARSGISIGEGAGLLLLERVSDSRGQGLYFLGGGESSDAYHMTAPHPQGLGAQQAMQSALIHSGLEAEQIDYVNLHATGTLKNDASEMTAFSEVFSADTACSGIKGLTGHTLGAAGGIEAVASLLALDHEFIPGTCGLNTADPDFQCNIIKRTQPDTLLRRVMSNNYGFGGNNASLIFSREI